MKTTFKPLGLVAAVAAASAGYAGIVNAQDPLALAGQTDLGDMAIVPYYTVQGSYATGISIINTSSETQVVKLRFRRAADSMDALDFNIIMSPLDVYTGYIQKDGDDIRFYSNDNSCTAPSYTSGDGQGTNWFTMPDIYRLGAEEGYVEIIGMAAADSAQPISTKAVHAAGTPVDCARVRDNFFAGTSPSDYGSTVGDPLRKGVISSETTNQLTAAGASTTVSNTYTDTGNVLKVSFFIKSDETGLEFGNNAVHIENFMDGPSMTNQQTGFFAGDLQGFDYPDLNGGATFSAVIDGIPGVGQRGSYELLRNAIGGTEVINDWSRNTNDLFSVDTDWVVTAPGQYAMTNLGKYIQSLDEATGVKCLGGTPGDDNYDATTGANCDFRDIPMTAYFSVTDREESTVVVEEGDLVISPQPPPDVVPPRALENEVNVIQWGDFPVLNAAKYTEVPRPDDWVSGWAQLSVTSNAATEQAICTFTALGSPDPTDMPVSCVSTDSPAPLVGFVAWQRNFNDLPEANYGRIVEHSFMTVSAAP